MKISANNLQELLQAYTREVRDKRAGETKAENGKKEKIQDRLTISSRAMEGQAISKRIKEMPEVREEKVAFFKQKIQAGNYEVKAEDLAERIASFLMGEEDI